MKHRLDIAPQARRDLQVILNWYRAELGARAALKVAATIKGRLDALQAGRVRGVEIDDAPGYRRASARRHVIVFREQGDLIQIVRIFHGARDVDDLVRAWTQT